VLEKGTPEVSFLLSATGTYFELVRHIIMRRPRMAVSSGLTATAEIIVIRNSHFVGLQRFTLALAQKTDQQTQTPEVSRILRLICFLRLPKLRLRAARANFLS
jgi:hypothetical protein